MLLKSRFAIIRRIDKNVLQDINLRKVKNDCYIV